MADSNLTQRERTIKKNSKVRFEFKLTVDNKPVAAAEGVEAIRYIHGKDRLIAGLEKNLTGMKARESKRVTVKPEEGFGLRNPAAYMEIPKAGLPPDAKTERGAVINVKAPNGGYRQARICQTTAETVTVDLNHPLASKALDFQLHVLEVA